MPEALSERVMNALKADPRTIDLRALAPHFYNLSERILELFEEEEMVEVLGDVSGCSISCIEACAECS
jgi:GINS complex subunit 3